MLIHNKYEVIDTLSSGEFGIILQVEYKKQKFVIKVGEIQMMKNELHIYKTIKELKSISKIYDVFTYEDKLCVVFDCFKMDLVGYKKMAYNAADYYNNIITYVQDLILIIKSVHSYNIIHRDLKPSNVCIDSNNKLYLIDFGLSRINIINNTHIIEPKIHSLIGSINFSSLNVLNLIEPAQRDDVESILYILFYLLLSKENYTIYDSIADIEKKNIDIFLIFLQDKTNIILNNIAINYLLVGKLFKYVRRLKYNQKPNYEYIIQLINEAFPLNIKTDN
jgi:serine/threonine protein kinase